MFALIVYYVVVFLIVALVFAWNAIQNLSAFNKAPVHKQVVEIAAANVKVDRDNLRGKKRSPMFKPAALGFVIMGCLLVLGLPMSASFCGIFAAGALASAIEQSITMHIARQSDVPMDLEAEAAAA